MWRRPSDKNICIRKSGRAQSPRRRLRDGRGGPRRVPGPDLDELLEDIARELAFALRREILLGGRNPGDNHQTKQNTVHNDPAIEPRLAALPAAPSMRRSRR